MDRPIVAVDVDDVLALTVEAWRLGVNDAYNMNLQPMHFKEPGEYSHYFEQVWRKHAPEAQINFEEMEIVMRNNPDWFSPDASALANLRKIKRKYDLIVMTARDKSWEDVTKQWVAKHFPSVFDDVYAIADHRAMQSKTKGQVCREIGAAFLVDDNVAYVQTALQSGVAAILFGDLPWQTDVPDGAIRCYTWAEVEDYLSNVR